MNKPYFRYSVVALSFFVLIVAFQNCGDHGEILVKDDITSVKGSVEDICAVNPTHPVCEQLGLGGDANGPTHAPTRVPAVGPTVGPKIGLIINPSNAPTSTPITTPPVPTPTVIKRFPDYWYVNVKAPVIPPVKIFLILDNSDSMRESQIQLANNVEKMFVSNDEGLRDYDSEVFIITTAQLNNLQLSSGTGSLLLTQEGGLQNDYQKVLAEMVEAQVAVNSWMYELRPNLDGQLMTNGLLMGDVLGFGFKTQKVPSPYNSQYDQTTMRFYPAYLAYPGQSNFLSVKHTKGQPITDMVQELKLRIELLDPERQIYSRAMSIRNPTEPNTAGSTTVNNLPLLDVVNKESGLCALGRIVNELKNRPQDSAIQKGDLVAFVVVSDEKDSSGDGSECVEQYSYRRPQASNLYEGQCADSQAHVSYEVPDKKTMTAFVRKPFVVGSMRLLQEHVDSMTNPVSGSCSIVVKQTKQTLNYKKNMHKLSFTRKVLDSNDDVVARSWTHTVQFEKQTVQHNVKFDRITLGHLVQFTREITTPQLSVTVSRAIQSRFQKVSYERSERIPNDSGSGTVLVEKKVVTGYSVPVQSHPAPEECENWLADLPSIKAQEDHSTNPKTTFTYTVQSCSPADTTAPDNRSQTFAENLPENCDLAFGRLKFPEISLAFNQSYLYSSTPTTCTPLPSLVQTTQVQKDLPGEQTDVCDVNYITRVDTDKPVVALPRRLSYSSSYQCSPHNETEANQVKTVLGPIPSEALTDPAAYVAQEDGNKSNVRYENFSVTNSTTAWLPQSVPTKSEPCPTDEALWLAEVRGQYGNPDNVNYQKITCTPNVVSWAEDSITVSPLDGKPPTATLCNSDYAREKDTTSKPDLTQGQYFEYSNVRCNPVIDNSLNKNVSRPLLFETLFENNRAVQRDCSSTEILDITQANTQGITFTLDGNFLEFSSCVVANESLPTSSSVRNAIVNTINGDANVKSGTSSLVCDAAINTFCGVGAPNNPNGFYGCSQIATSFIGAKAKIPEYRKYKLKPPVVDGAGVLHWYGLVSPRITVTSDLALNGHGGKGLNIPAPVTSSTVLLNLLKQPCQVVPGACSPEDESTNKTVEEYLTAAYAANDNAKYQALIANGKSDSDQTLTPTSEIPLCLNPFTTTATTNNEVYPGYDKCRSRSINATSSIAYEANETSITFTVGFADGTVSGTPLPDASCADLCDSIKCKQGSSSSPSISYQNKTMDDFYGGNCRMNPIVQYPNPTTKKSRHLAATTLSDEVKDTAPYQPNKVVCDLTCKESGLCKADDLAPIDLSSNLSVREFIARQNNVPVEKVYSCNLIRNESVRIFGKESAELVTNACTKPFGQDLPSKYLVSQPFSYPVNDLRPYIHELQKVSGELDLSHYIQAGFSEVLGLDFVNMASFSSQKPSLQSSNQPGVTDGAAYDSLARTVNGFVTDVKAQSTEYGQALKFLGDRVAAQISSSFVVPEIKDDQKINRVWYKSKVTLLQLVSLKPAEFSANGKTLVITNPDMINKMKNEADFRFFVEVLPPESEGGVTEIPDVPLSDSATGK